MTKVFVWLIAACLLLLPRSGVAAEKWADPRLRVTEGLQIWLDASRQSEFRQSRDQPLVKNGDDLDVWFDGSGQRRHFVQQNRARQPAFLMASEFSVVRFDGKDDSLSLSNFNQSLTDFTIFLVAAPRSNAGEYRALLAAHQLGKSDIQSGFTMDMGPKPTEQFETLNFAGAGFRNDVDLLNVSAPWNTFHTIGVVSTAGKESRLFLDSGAGGSRPRKAATLELEALVVGARNNSAGATPPSLRGFFHGDLAEVLLYDRALDDQQRESVEEYLRRKYSGIQEAMANLQRQKPLRKVDNPPPVQLLVPGFTVKQLPVELNNINSIKYRHDGKLVAMGYNGNLYLLSDSDGDGLEDRAELFWKSQKKGDEPVGMALTPRGYAKGNGVFIPSKGELLLIVDTDGDDKADQQIVVSNDWKKYPYGIDTVGVAVDPRDGSVYFGIGTADYTNPYLIDAQGKAHYSLGADHAAVHRLSADFQKREIFCTGTRFPVSLAFNRRGDLFGTDQEGATWLPNGNPFDELLHLQRGRHYGFPPRHPKHLPDAIDEPSTFDYGPQHQSACGLNFNEPVNGGPTFGPEQWASDALVCGFSRGKLYRTRLAHSSEGYIAQNQILACLNMLTVDACVSPQGALVVSTHSGGPDWGTGPTGIGKLYKINYTNRNQPQPVAIWAETAEEVHVAFDRPLDSKLLTGLAETSKIEYGQYVHEGDRFETLRPGYAAVEHQMATPRYELPMLGARLSLDRRTLILSTEFHADAAEYAITLPRFAHPDAAKLAAGELPQHPAIDLHYDLNGLSAKWESQSGKATWLGWLPHPNLSVSKQFTEKSAAHEQLWELMKQPGTLRLQTQVNLRDMLRPAVQPGSGIDYTWPDEKVTLVISAKGTVEAHSTVAIGKKSETVGDQQRVELAFPPGLRDYVPLEIIAATSPETSLSISYFTAEDRRLRPLSLNRLLVPWIRPKERGAVAFLHSTPPELEGGSWARGRRVFSSEQGLCFKCHQAHQQGGDIGPNLANLRHRDYASVLRDITEPSYAINPDYVAYTVVLKGGRVLTGSIRKIDGKLHLGDGKGEVTIIDPNDVEEMTAQKKSTMPDGIVKQLGDQKIKDLLTYLLTDSPHMPDYGEHAPPPPRRKSEVDAVLAGAPQPPETTRPVHVVLVAGKQDHPRGEHDYPAWQKTWQELLSIDEKTKVTTASNWPSAADLQSADVLVFYQHGDWTAERARDVDAFLKRGGGLVYIHWAVGGRKHAAEFAQRIGLAEGEDSKYRHGPLDIAFETGANSPIARNFSKVAFFDESYWGLVGDQSRINVLASGVEEGKPKPLLWTLEPSRGRVFVSIVGHFAWTFDDPLFRTLLLRGIAWAAKEPVDRYNALITIGVRIVEEKPRSAAVAVP